MSALLPNDQTSFTNLSDLPHLFYSGAKTRWIAFPFHRKNERVAFNFLEKDFVTVHYGQDKFKRLTVWDDDEIDHDGGDDDC